MVYSTVDRRVARLVRENAETMLAGGLKGLEKEALRVRPTDGRLADSPHPRALGSALTHRHITTDYSEALLEFITPPLHESVQAVARLDQIQRFVHANLDDETLWSASMPCVVSGDASIPIAYYGESNIGHMKRVYREGLSYRYGRLMQVISGVHFNYSVARTFWPVFQTIEGYDGDLQDGISEAYMGMVRNMQRYGWLLAYLFGCSPAVCGSFIGDRPTPLQSFNDGTLYYPFATTLRMSDIGYKNSNKAAPRVCYDTLATYIDTLRWAINTPHEEYLAIGVKVGGEYRQLNANILQIENEYYSSVRPKRTAASGEPPTLALQRRGVEYVELRSLDVNLFEATGVTIEQLRFLEVFNLFCLLTDSPVMDADERRIIEYNQMETACRGRCAKLHLVDGERMPRLRDWGLELCDVMQGVCTLLDHDSPDRPYARALAAQRDALLEPEATPSARMLAGMRDMQCGFHEFAMFWSNRHREDALARPLTAEQTAIYVEEARDSLARQKDIEADDDKSFDEFLRDYFNQFAETSAALEDVR